MKNIFLLLSALLCATAAFAQQTFSDSLTEDWARFQEKHLVIMRQYYRAQDSISAFKSSYKGREQDAAYDQQLALLREARADWRRQYDESRRKRSVLNRQQEVAMKQYHRSQPYFKYRNYSKYYLAGGITLVSTGGALVMGGLIMGMGETMQPLSKEEQRKQNVTMVTLFSTGVALALASIPLFRAATVNKSRYRRHITCNLKLDAVPAIGGSYSQTVGLGFRLPLFQGQRGF